MNEIIRKKIKTLTSFIIKSLELKDDLNSSLLKILPQIKDLNYLCSEKKKEINWIKEYTSLFFNKLPFEKESKIRMEKFLKDNPNLNKEIILEATKLYISKTNIEFLMLPHYFIEKGSGVNKTQTLYQWILYNKNNINNHKTEDETNKLH